MEQLDFSKGIHSDSEEVETPKGFYRDALNIRTSGDARRTEEGNLLMSNVPTNITVWGTCDIGEETIILGTINSNSIIGSINKEDEWTVEVPSRETDILGINEPVQVEGKKNWAGERTIYFSTASGARRINLDQPLPDDDVEFDKVTSLFLEYDLPRPSYIGETNAGTLKTGVYQFQVRLVTDSGAATSFGIPSPIIPIVKDSLSGSRDDITGDPPQTQTNKAIRLEITNIDSAFKYVEIGILTYEGLANTAKSYVTNPIIINNQSTIQFTYRGETDHADTLEIAELITSGAAYAAGKFFTQKDDYLLIGAPTEAEEPPIDWFRVAKNIVAKYTVKTIPFTENLVFEGDAQTNDPSDRPQPEIIETSAPTYGDTYKNPLTCALYKGHRRGEIYAFTLTPVYVNGVLGPTVHIPGNASTNTDDSFDIADLDAGGLLSTWVSEEVYPDDRYGAEFEGTGIRYHRFPKAENQPIISGNVETNNCKLRVLGVEFSNVVLDASEVQYSDKIAGIIFGRVDRRGQETQLAQGILRPNTDTLYLNNPQWGRGIAMGDGKGSFRWHPRQNLTNIFDKFSNENSTPDYSDFTFLSPDIIHGRHTAGEATHIYQHAAYITNPYACEQFEYDFNEFPGRSSFARGKYFFNNFLGDNPTLRNTMNKGITQLSGDKVSIEPFGVPLAPKSKGGKKFRVFSRGGKTLELGASMGCEWLGGANDAEAPYDSDYDYYYNSLQTTKQSDDDDDMQYLQAPGFRAQMTVHSLYRNNPTMYGPLDQQTSMFQNYTEWKTIKNNSDIASFYNGDTFINKYGLHAADEQRWPRPSDDGDEADSPNKIRFLKNPHMAGIIYFFLESDYNYDYKHFDPVEVFTEDNIVDQGTMPFYPAYKQLGNNEIPFGLLSMHAENWAYPGHAKEYNTQYSTQPTNKPYVNTPLEDITRKDSLQNRIIYSAQAVQGEKADAYQIFLPNNYYDVPQQYGELTDVYVNGELFASTPYVQWKLFFNAMATQATSAGQIVLGTGGAFNRPAVPTTTVDGGHGGNTHWLHAINTIYGRVFVDKYQGKIFILTDKLNPISGYLDDEYKFYIQGLDDMNIKVGAEHLRDRAFIQLGNDMWSYHLERNAFISKHSFNPRWIFSHGPYMYTNQLNAALGQTGIFKHSMGANRTYYGKQYPAHISLVANMAKTMSKHFKTIELQTNVKNESTNLNVPFKTFDYIEVWNKERYSGKVAINVTEDPFTLPGVLEVLSRKVKDSFRMIIPRDVVVDPQQDIFSTSNHKETSASPEPAEWLAKMRGTYVIIKLTSSLTTEPLWLFDASVGLAENIR